MSTEKKYESNATLEPFSRRGFLRAISSGSLVLMGRLASSDDLVLAAGDSGDVENFDPDFFVSIAPDSQVTLLAHRSEMGTGIRTSLPRIVADELEADWDRVVVKQARGDRRLGSQNTDGSNSIRLFFQRMRVAGATARTMLEQAAAKKWSVDAKLCYAENHQIKERGGKRVAEYGELVATARTLDVPKQDELSFKPRDKWRYIGKDANVTDLDDMLTGKAVYGIDARIEGQLFAVVRRSSVFGGKVKSFDASAAKKVPGVVEVVEIPAFQGAPKFQALGGVAVCATSTWAAIQGRDALKVEWDLGDNQNYDSEVFAKQLAETARKPGQVLRSQGDATTAIAQAKRVVKADYSVPHLAHGPMEPPCAAADVTTDATGKVTACRVVAATQNPQAVQQAVGATMGLPPADVLVEVTLLGSGFGRKSKPDYCVEAAIISRNMKRPIHVTWTREDDLRHDYYHAISAMHCEAALDEKGMPVAWLGRAVYPPIRSTFKGTADLPTANEAEMGLTDLPYDIPNLSLEVGRAKAHVRIGWLRSVAHIHQNFATSSFADELAHAAGRDPLEYLLALLGKDRHLDLAAAKLRNRGASPKEFPYDIGRLKNVLQRAAKLADWSRAKDLPKGRGMGIACCRSFLGFTGHVVEVEVTRDGKVHIPKVWVSIDAGTIVSPDRVVAQVEGAAIMATTQVRYGKMAFKNGRARQVNYDDYKMAKMSSSPREIVVDVVKTDAAPAGVGETGVPSFAPAFCNAVFAAAGKRIRDLPIADHDLSWS